MAWFQCCVLQGFVFILISLSLLANSCLCLSDFISPHSVYSITSKIGANNFTYFKLLKNGKIKIVLNSVEGDADLYISSSTLYPSYNNYELKSATCGEDVVEVPSDMKRPLGVGVFGHPFIDETLFELQVFAYDDEDDTDSVTDETEGGKKDSILWTIFLNILKIIIDVLV